MSDLLPSRAPARRSRDRHAPRAIALVLAIVLAAAALGGAAQAELTPEPIPTVAIPSANAVVSGFVPLDSDGGSWAHPGWTPAAVTYELDGQQIGRATLTGYGWIKWWDSRTVADGWHTVRAFAWAAEGGVYISAPRNFGVLNRTVSAAPSTSTAAHDSLGFSIGGNPVPAGMTTSQFWDALDSTGAGWARVDGVPWSYGNVTSVDGTLAQARRVGLRVVLTLTYGQGGVHQIPTSTTERQQWAEWAGAVARHAQDTYPGTVGAYEIWNEANQSQFAQLDPAAYTDLLRRTYPQLKAVTPTIPVLTSGLSPNGGNGPAGSGNLNNPADFVNAIYANGGGSSFDAVANHPYETWYWQYVNLNGSGYRATHWIRQVMNAHGDGAKEIWGTEAGWPSCYKYPSSAPTGLGLFTEDQRVSRFRADMKDWFHGTHDPATGATTGTSSSGDWNTGPFMIFKLFKAGVDPGLGVIYGAGGQCGQADWYQPPLVAAIRDFAG